MASQIVLISGCSSGIGLATAVFLAKDAERRFKVYATMRNLAKKGQLEEEGKDCLGDTLIIKQMDVCSDESVEKAVKEVLDAEGRIDVLCKFILLGCVQNEDPKTKTLWSKTKTDQWLFVLDHRVLVLDLWVLGLWSSIFGLRFQHIHSVLIHSYSDILCFRTLNEDIGQLRPEQSDESVLYVLFKLRKEKPITD